VGFLAGEATQGEYTDYTHYRTMLSSILTEAQSLIVYVFLSSVKIND